MSDGDEGNKEGDRSEMRGLEGEERDQPLEGNDPKKHHYGSRLPAGHERAETDGLFKAAASRVSRNPAGYLVQSIRDDYQIPESRTRGLPWQSTAGQPRWATRLVQRGSKRHEAADHDRHSRVEQYLSPLSPGELLGLEQAAMASASRMAAEGYCRAKAGGNQKLAEEYRRLILRCHVEQILGRQAAPV